MEGKDIDRWLAQLFPDEGLRPGWVHDGISGEDAMVYYEHDHVDGPRLHLHEDDEGLEGLVHESLHHFADMCRAGRVTGNDEEEFGQAVVELARAAMYAEIRGDTDTALSLLHDALAA